MVKPQQVEHDEPPSPAYPDNQLRLPPVDSGWPAWRFVLGCYLVEGFCWGLVISFGVFQKHYSQEPVFRESSSYMPIIGTWNASLACFLNPPITKILLKYPRLNVPFVWLGLAVCVAGLFLASFANNVWQLILFQGVMYGTGWSLNYSPWSLLLNQWFVEKRGLVYGVICGASGLAAMALPFVLEPLLERFGFRVALRIIALSLAVVAGPPMLFIKPRLPPARTQEKAPTPAGPSPFRSPAFIIFMAAYVLSALGWFLPRFYMPSFAADLGYSHETSSSLLAVWGAAQVVGQLGLGWASDKVTVFLPTAFALGVPAAATFFLWGPAKTAFPLALFTALYGGFGGGFAALIGRMAMYCSVDDDNAIMVTALVQLGRGIGASLSGPISALLIGDEFDLQAYALGKYKNVALFVGLTMGVGALSGLGYFFTKDARALPSGERASQEEENSSSNVFLLEDQEPRPSIDSHE